MFINHDDQYSGPNGTPHTPSHVTVNLHLCQCLRHYFIHFFAVAVPFTITETQITRARYQFDITLRYYVMSPWEDMGGHTA